MTVNSLSATLGSAVLAPVPALLDRELQLRLDAEAAEQDIRMRLARRLVQSVSRLGLLLHLLLLFFICLLVGCSYQKVFVRLLVVSELIVAHAAQNVTRDRWVKQGVPSRFGP